MLQPSTGATNEIADIHLVFKTHLDIGFTDFARNVVAEYLDFFIPRAVRCAAVLRRTGRPERLVWTTGSWLVHEYLERATPEGRRGMEAAILAGDIAWHALPFTVHSELLDPSLFAYGLTVSRDLDARFGRRTIAAKMSDVPGHTRGIVPLLAAAGIEFLHLGVNTASTPPDVPPVFLWRDEPSGAEIVVMYEPSYGAFATVPGSSAALAIVHTGDNGGPPSLDAVLDAFTHLRAEHPGATVRASTLDAFARAILPLKQTLPVVTAEIGDTWIHGAGSDPVKMSRYRERCRLRRAWLADGRLTAADPRFGPFSRALLLVAEHTWGMDTKKYLGDWESYDAERFAAALPSVHFQEFAASWAEQRGYLDEAVAALGDSRLAEEARDATARLRPRSPDPAGWTPVDAEDVAVETAHFQVRFDPGHGSLIGLREKGTARAWAAPNQPLGLLSYQAFGAADYTRFINQYVRPELRQVAWALQDQGKPGLERTLSEGGRWLARLDGLHRRHDAHGDHFLLDVSLPIDDPAVYGAPRRAVVEISFPTAAPEVHWLVQWFDKPANRIPEAIWCSFAPAVQPDGAWFLDKLGAWLPVADVVPDGNRRLHAVGSGVRYRDATSALTIETPDAPLVSLGGSTLLEFRNELPHAADGVHVNLVNTCWGTNFPQWFGEDARFRFVCRVGLDGPPSPPILGGDGSREYQRG